MCGKLYCSGGWEMPSYGSLVTFESCKASFPRNGDTDLGMILNGTKCGDGMVCSNGECVYAEDVFRSSDCSAKCPGHAVCDHEMQCQCEEGWAPPNCDSSSAVTSKYYMASCGVHCHQMTETRPLAPVKQPWLAKLHF